MAMKVHGVVFCLYSDVVGYHHFGEPCCLLHTWRL